MIMFLRNDQNETILDVDCYIKRECEAEFVEINSFVCIDAYSKLLLGTPEEYREELITTFDFLQELRGWLWENFFMNKKNTGEHYDAVIEELRSLIKGIAKKWELCYVED